MPGRLREDRHNTSRIPGARKSGNSPSWLAFRHWLGMAKLDLGSDVFEELHTGSAGREVLFDLGVPLETVSFREPSGQASLLLRRERFDGVPNLCQVHALIVLRRAALCSPMILSRGRCRLEEGRRRVRCGVDLRHGFMADGTSHAPLIGRGVSAVSWRASASSPGLARS